MTLDDLGNIAQDEPHIAGILAALGCASSSAGPPRRCTAASRVLDRGGPKVPNRRCAPLVQRRARPSRSEVSMPKQFRLHRGYLIVLSTVLLILLFLLVRYWNVGP